MLAKIGAAVCNRLVANSVETKDFFTDYPERYQEAIRLAAQEPKQRTPEDIAAEWRAMGATVVVKERES